MDLEGLRRRLLDARDARAALLAALANPTVVLSLNVPGPHKNTLPLDRVFALGQEALRHELPGGTLLAEGRDALGPYAAVAVRTTPRDAKLACVRIEESLPVGRLLDLDVVAPGGEQVHRASLGLLPRLCLVCDAPAADCIRAGRHSPAELSAAVLRLVRSPLTALARALVEGARAELDLTPKPGLVNRFDNGSHPDLSYDLMSRSLETLPGYYDDLIEIGETEPLDLAACVAAGVRAERRMQTVAGSNTHRGYIFLSGLLLLGVATDATGTMAGWRAQVAALGNRIVSARVPMATHGEEARRQHGVGGVLGEALAGLPSVFDHGLPALQRGLATLGSLEAAQHYLMGVLMTTVEDTTALHRCGPAGLARLREDGARLVALIEAGGDHRARLRALNDEYRAIRLTMGGVADCLALTLAVQQAAGR